MGTTRWTLTKFRDGSCDPRGCPGQVGGPSGWSETGRWNHEWSGTGLGTLREVQDWSGDSRRGPEWFEEVRDWSGNPPSGPERVRGTSLRSRTGWETLGEVWDGLGYPLGGQGRVERPPKRNGMGRGTHRDVRDGPGRFGTIRGTSLRSGTGLGTLREVGDSSGVLPLGPGWVGRPH